MKRKTDGRAYDGARNRLARRLTTLSQAILWTEFLGKDFFKMQYARKNMNDFVVIKKAYGTRLMPEETVDLFQESKRLRSRFDLLETWQ